MQIKMQLHWNKEFNRSQSTGGPSLEASNVISDTCYLENKDLLFRGAGLVLLDSTDNLDTEISPFRAQSLYQDEINHIVKVPTSLHWLWEEPGLSSLQDRMAALETWKVRRRESLIIASKCFGRQLCHVMVSLQSVGSSGILTGNPLR